MILTSEPLGSGTYVNDLPRVATWQGVAPESNPWPGDRKSSALTTMQLRHTLQ